MSPLSWGDNCDIDMLAAALFTLYMSPTVSCMTTGSYLWFPSGSSPVTQPQLITVSLASTNRSNTSIPTREMKINSTLKNSITKADVIHMWVVLCCRSLDTSWCVDCYTQSNSQDTVSSHQKIITATNTHS